MAGYNFGEVILNAIARQAALNEQAAERASREQAQAEAMGENRADRRQRHEDSIMLQKQTKEIEESRIGREQAAEQLATDRFSESMGYRSAAELQKAYPALAKRISGFANPQGMVSHNDMAMLLDEYDRQQMRFAATSGKAQEALLARETAASDARIASIIGKMGLKDPEQSPVGDPSNVEKLAFGAGDVLPYVNPANAYRYLFWNNQDWTEHKKRAQAYAGQDPGETTNQTTMGSIMQYLPELRAELEARGKQGIPMSGGAAGPMQTLMNVTGAFSQDPRYMTNEGSKKVFQSVLDATMPSLSGYGYDTNLENTYKLARLAQEIQGRIQVKQTAQGGR